MEDRMESLTQKRSHGSSDKEHPVLFRPLFYPNIWGCLASESIRALASCLQSIAGVFRNIPGSRKMPFLSLYI
jgi:hypothetical protein